MKKEEKGWGRRAGRGRVASMYVFTCYMCIGDNLSLREVRSTCESSRPYRAPALLRRVCVCVCVCACASVSRARVAFLLRFFFVFISLVFIRRFSFVRVFACGACDAAARLCDVGSVQVDWCWFGLNRRFLFGIWTAIWTRSLN